MSKIVTARLEPIEEKILKGLTRRLQLSSSEVIREGLKLMEKVNPPNRIKSRVKGIGVISSGITDLASNKRHLKGFGG